MNHEAEKVKGRLFVLSAPSGSGKSTLKDKVLQRLPDLVFSVSYTTRKPRPGEIDGRDYNFVSETDFKNMIDKGQFLEWAEVFGRFYGTGRHWVEQRLGSGHNVLLDIDVEGAASVRKIDPAAILIFMVPPSLAELRRRLSDRRTEAPEEIERRLSEARREIDRRGLFNYLLVNDDADRAAGELAAIISQGQGRNMAETEAFWAGFLVDWTGRPA